MPLRLRTIQLSYTKGGYQNESCRLNVFNKNVVVIVNVTEDLFLEQYVVELSALWNPRRDFTQAFSAQIQTTIGITRNTVISTAILNVE